MNPRGRRVARVLAGVAAAVLTVFNLGTLFGYLIPLNSGFGIALGADHGRCLVIRQNIAAQCRTGHSENAIPARINEGRPSQLFHPATVHTIWKRRGDDGGTVRW